ncbi:MAG: TlpA family protein disulfide reductase [Cocleimonas sp.]|nr:TlpA family protein disulfide reductase [Cocleimonas sp.]
MKHITNPLLAANHWLVTSILTFTTLIFLSSSLYAFTDLNGKKVDIKKQLGKGKWSIVELWAHDCHACRKHMPSMVKFDGKLKNARIIGISLDGQAGINDAKSFIKDFNIKFETIISNPIEVNAWMLDTVGEGLIGTPTFILFDPKGKLVAAQPGLVAITSLETFIKENSKPIKK